MPPDDAPKRPRAQSKAIAACSRKRPAKASPPREGRPAWADFLTVEGGKLNLTAKGDPFRSLGGSEHVRSFNLTMLVQVVSALNVAGHGDVEEELLRVSRAAAAALDAFKPKDEIEGMIAAQAVALHFQAMDCFRRAVLAKQPEEMASRLRRDGANLMRAMTEMVEALNRKRGKGPQVVRVERVIVQEGGQAIVGAVAAGAPPPALPPAHLGPVTIPTEAATVLRGEGT